jgi:Transposase DDE domain group 1
VLKINLHRATGGFRVKQKVQQKLSRRERRVRHRIDKANWSGQSPMIDPPAIRYELADRVQAMAPGGLGVIQQMVKQLDLAETINRKCPVFKMRLPYSEADHVLNIAYNLLVGGTCLEHLELRRQDEAYLNALGAERIPDPTTAGDFCRRFSNWDVFMLSETLHEARLKVWRQQPDSFLDLAIIEADGAMVETLGERKEGLGMNYKGQWGYHPLIMTLANTREVLYLVNRSGNRPSHEGASLYFDLSIDLCRRAGFRKIRLRGDTDFSQTRHLDGWHEEGVEFVFGLDAMPNLVEIADNLPNSAWNVLKRKQRTSAKPRAKRPNTKQQIVIEKEYTNKRLEKEFVAEFDYSPGLCGHTYRVVVLRKQIAVTKGQQKLFDDSPYFFYITNISREDLSAEAIVGESNQRCDQENIISQLKQMGALSAPLHTLTSNGAYMVMASLAWNLKAWLALSLTETGPEKAKAERRAEKQRLLRMDFSTFRQTMIQIPAQIIRSARRLIYRLLAWSPGLKTLFRLSECVSQPLLC